MGVDFRAGRRLDPPSAAEVLKRIDALARDETKPPSDRLEEIAPLSARLLKQLHDEGELSDYPCFESADTDLQAHFAYGGFDRFRSKLAAAEGITLSKMWGFLPSNGVEAYLKAQKEDPSSLPIPVGRATEEMHKAALEKAYAEAGRWDDQTTPLKPLLNHSDCEDEMTAAECRQVAPRLREIVEGWSNEPPPKPEDVESSAWFDDNPDRRAGLALVELMEFCAEHDYELLFR